MVRAERDLDRADVTAPYAGRVRSKNVDVGQFVTVGTSIATVYAVDVAEVRLPLPDGELAYLDLPLAYRGTSNQRGPHVTLSTTFAGARYEWTGRVVRTEGEIDPVSRMVHVVAEVQDPYAVGPDPNRPPLAVGMYVEAQIEVERSTRLSSYLGRPCRDETRCSRSTPRVACTFARSTFSEPRPSRHTSGAG